jgi:hypothetical protein
VIRVAAAVCALGALTGAAWAARPSPQSQAQADGCATGASSAYVGDKDAPAEGPAPGPRSASGIARVSRSGTELVLDVAGGELAGKANAAGRLELRREATPWFAWPEQGDRVTALGSWVWACGVVGSERTELHPFRVLWVQRRFSARSPTSEAEGDLYIAPDATAAGVDAECAHSSKTDSTAYSACLATPRVLDVAGDYAFTLAAPSRPKGAGPLQVRIVDQGGGGPDPTVTIAGATARVTLHLAAGTAVAKQIFLGWSNMPEPALPEHLKVRFKSLVIRSATAPWSLTWDIAGIWGPWRGRQILDVYVPRRTAWRVSAQAEGGLGGTVSDRFASPEDGLGLRHGLPLPSSSGCDLVANPKGCFQLDYVVTRVG